MKSGAGLARGLHLSAPARAVVRKLVLLVVLFLLLLPRCELAWFWECSLNSDCDDGNPCTTDRCNSEWEGPCTDSGCGDDCRRYFCENFAVDDGTSCEVDGQTGVCESGECRRDDETADGGV